MHKVLSVQGLSKRYTSKLALNNFSIDVEKGQVVGILGPNGSGKTTFLSIVLGLRSQTKGEFSWFGNPNGFISGTRIGALVEVPYYFPYLTLEDNMRLSALVKNLPASSIYSVIERVGLTANLKTRLNAFSLGMKQRMAIAQTILGSPEVIVLDEPTNGLDPEGVVEVRKLINELSYNGQTVIVASHNLDEIQRICSHVAILKGGELISSGLVSQLLSLAKVAVIEVDKPQLLLQQINKLSGLELFEYHGNLFTLLINNHTNASSLVNNIGLLGIGVVNLQLRNLTLEEFFIHLVRSKK